MASNVFKIKGPFDADLMNNQSNIKINISSTIYKFGERDLGQCSYEGMIDVISD